MELIGSKSGNGAFKVERDGDVFAVTIDAGEPSIFANAALAYDWAYAHHLHLSSTMRSYSYLNACFELEPFVADARN
jgi:hypothetical protein